MAKYVVYAHNRLDVESDIIYICTCDTQEIADSIASALKYRDTGGRDDDTTMYNYYTKKEDWIV